MRIGLRVGVGVVSSTSMWVAVGVTCDRVFHFDWWWWGRHQGSRLLFSGGSTGLCWQARGSSCGCGNCDAVFHCGQGYVGQLVVLTVCCLSSCCRKWYFGRIASFGLTLLLHRFRLDRRPAALAAADFTTGARFTSGGARTVARPGVRTRTSAGA